MSRPRDVAVMTFWSGLMGIFIVGVRLDPGWNSAMDRKSQSKRPWKWEMMLPGVAMRSCPATEIIPLTNCEASALWLANTPQKL